MLLLYLCVNSGSCSCVLLSRMGCAGKAKRSCTDFWHPEPAERHSCAPGKSERFSRSVKYKRTSKRKMTAQQECMHACVCTFGVGHSCVECSGQSREGPSDTCHAELSQLLQSFHHRHHHQVQPKASLTKRGSCHSSWPSPLLHWGQCCWRS